MKKKILTLAFALVLLVGLVAAMGMNASAAGVPTALNRSSVVYTADNLWNYVAQSYDGDVIVLGQDITYDDKNDSEPYVLPFGSQSDMVLDLNGHTLDITTRADALIELDYGATRLHIINSKPETPAKIIMRTTVGNSSMIDISKKECGVYVYEGVELVMGEKGDQAEAYRQTSVIKATAFSDIALYGATVTNNIANGNGIKFESHASIDFDNSTVTLHGGAVINAETSCIHLSDSYDYPTFKIGSAHLNCNEEYYEAIFNYIPASSASSQVKALTFGDILFSSKYAAYNATAGGRLDNNGISNSQKLIDFTTECDITFKLPGVLTECYHASTKSLLNSFCGHYTVCSDCYHLMEIEEHTRVEATVNCTSDGYTGGYNCACGYKTIKPATAYGHKYITYAKADATCTEYGYTNTMYKCENCSTYFDSNKNETSFRVFSQNTIAPLGHDYKETVAAKATLTSDGVIASKCTRCGDIQSAVSLAKIGSVTLSQTEYVHDGKNKTPRVTVTDANGNKLVKNVDYKTSVASKRSGIGKYTVKVTFIGKYEGTKKVYFTILPGKPASVKSASQTTSSVKLSWSKVSGAVGYTVYRYSPSKKAYVKAGTTEGTSLTVSKLYAGTKYTFRVVAYGKTSGGKVYNSESYALLKTATKTKTPELTKVTASSTKGKAYVYHSNVSGETGYTVYYSTSKTSGFKKYNNFKADTTRCDITGLTSGKTYYFKVRTYIKTDSGYVYSAWSAVKSVKVK